MTQEIHLSRHDEPSFLSGKTFHADSPSFVLSWRHLLDRIGGSLQSKWLGFII